MSERQSIGAGVARRARGPDRLRGRARRDRRPSGDRGRQARARADRRLRGQGTRAQNTSAVTLTALSQGRMPGPRPAGKLVGAVLQQEASSFAMELAGAAGGLLDAGQLPEATLWAERYLSIPGLRIAGGTDEVLRNIIAERVLGLPPDARADKGIAFKDILTGPPSKK
ncbi:MAG: acyl-CoA dehydrogenase family protein [Myxococcota bacterium]